MNGYIAKQASLITMNECKNPGCGCFTRNGYYIQYKKGNTDSLLFVCEKCYEEKYRNTCTLGDFDSDQYVRRQGANRYPVVNPVLRNLIRWCRKASKTTRIAFVTIAVILVVAFCLKEKPDIRTEYQLPNINMKVNSAFHIELRNLEPMSELSKSIANQFEKVLSHGGKRNDQ